MDYYAERRSLAACFRWTARLDMHEAVANHFSLAVGAGALKFLINPNQVHFSQIRASDLLLLNADDDYTQMAEAPDPTAWFLHRAMHKNCRQARCVMHLHSIFSTILACLADSRLPPIDQNSATFFERHIVDDGFDGLALEQEAERCARLMSDPKCKTMIMGNHGVMVVGDTVADCFNRLYYFERAAQTYVGALQTGRPLRVMPDDVARKTAEQIEHYPEQAARHLAAITAILDREGADYAN